MSYNQKGRFYKHGKSLEECVKGEIIDSVLEAGGDRMTGFFSGMWKDIGDKHSVHGKTVKEIWERFVNTGSVEKTQRFTGNPAKLGPGELHLIEAMKTDKPSLSYKNVLSSVLQHGNLPAGTSVSAIGRAVRTRMSEGKMTWKRMTRSIHDKFTVANINYCQDFLDFMSQVDPYRVKFFDESGVSLQDSNKRYGHSTINTPCVEVGRHLNSRNMTLNLLAGLDGILYANTLDGAADTIEFLNFFGEASQNSQRNGNPVLMAGDIIVFDNCRTHHYAGGFALAHWLDSMGIDVVYLPTYSPEFNPVELVFQKLKVVLKREEMQQLVSANVHAAVYTTLEEITENDMVGFYRNTGYLFV